MVVNRLIKRSVYVYVYFNSLRINVSVQSLYYSKNKNK